MHARLLLVLSLLLASVARAEDSFTQTLTPADFQAAGLGKLTPDELARLDALVKNHQTGVVAKVTEETAKVVTAEVREQVKAEVTAQVKAEVTAQVKAEVTEQVKAEDKKEAQKQAASSSLMSRVKVLLTPGTEIEYSTLDATLLPPFHGWQKGTVFYLSNGQRWMASDGDSYWAPLTDKPLHVRIVPGLLGSFFMEIEHGGRPRVKFLGSTPPAPQKAPEANP